jgi:hypothetical protein
MTRYFDHLATQERDGFTIVIDKTYEDTDPWDSLCECFDSREELFADIDSGKYEWFMLRVRAMVNGHTLADEWLGGCLYENAEDVLTDGIAEDLIEQAVTQAKSEVRRLRAIFESIA